MEIEQVVHNSNHSTKSFFLVGDLNLHSLDYASSTPLKKIFNFAFENRIITDQDLQNGIIKLDISDDFPIFTILNSKIHNECLKAKISTRAINILSSTDWIIPFDLTILDKTITNESYDQFIKTFSLIYYDCFPIKIIEIKTKNLLSPWITKGIKKSSKRKQKLYERFLKKKSPKRFKKIPRKNIFKKNLAFIKTILKIHGKL